MAKRCLKLLTLSFLIICTFQSRVLGQIVINEYCTTNITLTQDNNGAYEDWIELYNAGSLPIDIGGYYLSDKNFNTIKWQIPPGTVIGADDYLLFWTSGRDQVAGNHYHTNFKLSQTNKTPEFIIFSDPNENIIDQVRIKLSQLYHSRGRTTDGDSQWSIFNIPSPGADNTDSKAYKAYTRRPVIDRQAGFYNGPFTVTITAPESNAKIYYTLDGTDPSITSTVYSGPISITKTTLIKAAAFIAEAEYLWSFIDFHTYFMNEVHTLPVISFGSEDLFPLLNGDKSYFPQGSMEYFNIAGVRTNTGFGDFNSHGQDSWVHDQRSIDFISRDEMGYDSAIREKIFADSDREEFQRIILRAAGDDNYPGIDTSAHLRDMYAQMIAQQGNMYLDVRTSTRCIMYVNGKYWGIYTIREKVDDPDFMKYYYGQNKYNIEFLMIWGNTWIEYGGSQTLNEWRDFQNFIVTNDMSDPETYQTVVDKFDFKSLIDYVLINEYVVCSDWLNWNTGWWRGLDSTGLHQKWGYILWDDDATFGHYINYSWVPDRSPYGDPCFAEGMWQADTEGHIDILNKLRENSEFEQYYISRYIDLYNTAFSCDFVISLLDSLAEVIRPEMTQHTDKWGGSLMEWEDNITKLRTFVTERCEFYPSGLNDCYTLTGPYPFLVSTDPVDVGEIQLNSLRLKEFPFEGSYFSGVDIKLEIFNTDSTYVFDHWKSTHTPTPNSSSKSIVLNIDTIVLNINRGDTVTAVFKKIKIIENFDLSARAYPNPFDGSTKLVYTVPEVMDVSINIYNILGQNIDFLSLDKKTHQPGRYELDINADDLGMLRGIYFVKFRAGDFSKVIKIMRN